MKNLFFLIAAAAFLALGSCSDDENKKLGITLAGEPTVSLTPGVRVSIPSLFSFEPSRDAFTELQFKVGDTSIAVVDGENLRFASNGETTVQVVGNGKIESPTIRVICTSPVTGVDNLVSRVLLMPGESMALSEIFSVVPETASVPELEFKVEDQTIAKIQDGHIHFVAVGTTGITAYATDGSGLSSKTVEVICSEPIEEKDLLVTASSYTATELVNNQTGERFIPLPSCVIDGEAGTYWQSEISIMTKREEWLLVDMKSVGSIHSVTLTDNVLNHTLAFDIYVSDTDRDGLSADDASLVKAGSGSIDNLKVEFTERAARYVKIVFTDVVGDGGLAFYATVTDVDIK